MKDIVAKITAIWDSLKNYAEAFINSFLGANDADLITKIKGLIDDILGTAKVAAEQIEEEE
ncbi:MAG: hypothetical protein IJU56_09010 [Clostridia bacterium]|nr:hypothetical protein [Clostridia bacterium]